MAFLKPPKCEIKAISLKIFYCLVGPTHYRNNNIIITQHCKNKRWKENLLDLKRLSLWWLSFCTLYLLDFKLFLVVEVADLWRGFLVDSRTFVSLLFVVIFSEPLRKRKLKQIRSTKEVHNFLIQWLALFTEELNH